MERVHSILSQGERIKLVRIEEVVGHLLTLQPVDLVLILIDLLHHLF